MISLLLIMTLSGAIAASFSKKAAISSGVMFKINLLFSGGFYVIAALLNIYVLNFLQYSIVLPMTSLTYIWTILIARQLFKETITSNKIYGLCFIGFGVMLLGSEI